MADEAAGALADLRALCDRRPVWAPDPTRDLGPDPRDSAVLVLFGALDDAPARTDRPAVARDLDVLLTRRSPTLRHHPGQVSFPGGGIDPEDAGPAAAALREAAEEAGVDPAGVRVLGTLPPLPVTVSRNLVTPVLAWWTRPSEVAATDPAETVDVFRVPVADLVDPANRVTAVVRHGGREHRGPAFVVPVAAPAGGVPVAAPAGGVPVAAPAGGVPVGGAPVATRATDVVVWGFTAHVLDRLLDALGWAEPWDATRTVPAPVR